MVVQSLRFMAAVVTGFTAAQELAFALYMLRSYTATHTGGGGAIDPAGAGGFKKRTSYPNSNIAGRICGTGALSAGTQTLDAVPIGYLSASELAAAATVHRVKVDSGPMVLDPSPIILAQNEGLLVRNEIAMGAAGTVKAAFSMDWYEVAAYP
jgi:hypothetical protein